MNLKLDDLKLEHDPKSRTGVPAADVPRADPTPVWFVVASYIGFPLTSLVLVLAALQITSIDDVTHAPLLNYHDGDALLIVPIVKDLVEHGSHWTNERMGAPGTFQLYDFPIIDYVHFFGLWVLGKLTGSYVIAFNGYFLLTYPLTTLTTLAVFRRFGFSLPAGGAAGLLYAFLCYHAVRAQSHYFLSAYWVVPLSLFVVLRVAGGTPPLTEVREGRLRWALHWRSGLGAIGIAILSALAGAYYAFFTCLLLGFASVYGSIMARSWKPALVSVVLLGALSAAGVAAHIPTYEYQALHGKNKLPTERQPNEAEYFGLKVAPLFLPPDHRLEAVRRQVAKYDDGRPLPSENNAACLGLVGGIGVLVAGIIVLLPGGHRWPYGPLGSLILFAILFATIGGLGAIFNFFVTPQVRAYSRMSVFIAFLGLFAALWPLDRWLGAVRGLRWVVFVPLGVLGVLEETPRTWFSAEMVKPRERNAAQFDMDAAFFAQVEEVVPGGMVFVLPHLYYPENILRYRMTSAYGFATGYLHTRTVRWSFGSMRGREINQWQEETAALPVPEMTRRLVAAGFDAVCVDTFGYPEAEGKNLVAELTALCGPPRATQADGSRMLFDLRPLRQRTAQ
jgi:hypothetical protein